MIKPLAALLAVVLPTGRNKQRLKSNSKREFLVHLISGYPRKFSNRIAVSCFLSLLPQEAYS